MTDVETYKDESTLRQLYLEEGLSTYEVADRLDTKPTTLLYWMDKFEIERRDVGSGSFPSDKKPDEKELERLYCEEKKSTIELSSRFDVASATITNWLRSYDLPVRSRAESLAQYVPDEDLLYKLHWEDKLKLYEIAERFDVNNRTVSGWFNRRDIPIREYTGEEAANWQGGYEEYYGPNWPKQRRKRLDRDGWECVVCSVSNEEHKNRIGTSLHVHHIQPMREFKEENTVDYESANDVENLITLCQSCHNKWEGIPLRPQT